MKSFQSLGIRAPILSALADCGYETPTVIQEKAIPAGIQGRDVLGAAQTGTGKTCAFGVPILQRLNKEGHKKHIRALILTPTRELAIQIDENLKAYGKNLPLTEAVIFGGVGQQPQVDQIKKGVDILTATPGRLLDLCGQGLLDLSAIEIFVLDEADRMLDMGFIHDVRKVIKLLPAQKQTMFFSATLPDEIMDLVDTLLHDPVKVAAAPVSSPVEVIRQEVCLVDRKNKTDLLVHLIGEENVKNALVFTRTKHGADKVARDLVKRGVSAAAIHGNKSQTARQESLRKFKAGEIQCLVATDIAARGLDIEELSHVFNYNLSEVPETYIHRIGRTGRAGHGGTAISFCDYGEQPMLKDIEKLLKKPVPRREHAWPMEVFEAPVDAKGRPVNAEDAEARQAAKEKRAAERKAKAEQKATQTTEAADTQTGKKKKKSKSKAGAAPMAKPDAVETLAPAQETYLVEAKPVEKPAKERRAFPHGKQNLTSLQDFLDAQPPAESAEPFYHRDPLRGEKVMDATARLLASKPVYQYYKPHEKKGKQKRDHKRDDHQDRQKSRKEDAARQTAPVRQTASVRQTAPVPKQEVSQKKDSRKKAKEIIEEKQAAKGHGKARKDQKAVTNALPAALKPDRKRNRGKSNRIPPRVEPPRSSQKDSTEQRSLMKPFYISHD